MPTHRDDAAAQFPITSVAELPVAEAAAWIALFCLRNSVPEGAQAPPLHVLHPHPARLSREEVVAWLVDQTKPVSCVARVGADALAIQCRPVVERARDRDRSWQVRSAVEMYESHSVNRIVFVGRGEALVATADAALRWVRDYQHWTSLAGDSAHSWWAEPGGMKALARKAGADFVYLLFPTPFAAELWEGDPGPAAG